MFTCPYSLLKHTSESEDGQGHKRVRVFCICIISDIARNTGHYVRPGFHASGAEYRYSMMKKSYLRHFAMLLKHGTKNGIN